MTIQVIDSESMQKYSADEAHHIVLHKSDRLVTLLVCLEPGQVLGPCVMNMRVQYVVMAGNGLIHVADEQAGLKTGSVVVIPAGVVRSIVAVERMRLLAVQVP
jgi:quercetin dioxygenase-like cupin family protein